MNKPVYASILEHSPSKPVLVFVASRRQTRLTALDLISYCAADDDPKQFLHVPEDEITTIAQTLTDGALKTTIVFGIGMYVLCHRQLLRMRIHLFVCFVVIMRD